MPGTTEWRPLGWGTACAPVLPGTLEPKSRRGTFREIIDQAINQTLSRTLITSGTVFIATLALYVFGGGAINDFAFTFLIGIITGTYSSIYMASALVLWWHKGERPAIGEPVQGQSPADQVPAA